MFHIFSSTMRFLHTQALINEDLEGGTSKLIELRDRTRKNSLIYIESLLPKSDEVIRTIKAYAFEVNISEFEDWQEILEDLIQKLIESEKACTLLLQLHEALIIEFKKSEDEALVGIGEIAKTRKTFEMEKKRLLQAATINLKDQEYYDKLAILLMIPTLGIGTKIARHKSAQAAKEAQVNIDLALVAEEEGYRTLKAFSLSKRYLIPAVRNFICGLQACGNFLTTTRLQLSGMSQVGQEEASKRYFRVMKAHAEQLDRNCLTFLTSLSKIRTDIKSIPTVAGDQQYVDGWIAQQMDQFNM